METTTTIAIQGQSSQAVTIIATDDQVKRFAQLNNISENEVKSHPDFNSWLVRDFHAQFPEGF
jgi:hypothetical protein